MSIKSLIKRFQRILISNGGKYRLLTMLNELLYQNHISETSRTYHGIASYYADSARSKHVGELRRNIHRIEKGLISKNRKDVFAVSYLLETVRSYSKLVESNNIDERLWAWAHSVLTYYFQIVDRSLNNVVNDAYDVFVDVPEPRIQELSITGSFTPFPVEKILNGETRLQNTGALPHYTMMLSEVFAGRRSTRSFIDEKVPSQVLEAAIIGASSAPSACNRQAFKLHTFSKVTDSDKFNALMDLPIGADSFKDDVYNLGVLIGDLSYFNHPRDRHIPYIDGALFLMQFLQCLTASGLASCVINWSDIGSRNRAIGKLLNLKKDQFVVCYVVFGYADHACLVPASVKKSLSNIWVNHD